ncbi:Xylose ABC transporter [Pseudomonas amygdali pv. morsprunorum]|nr:Xylose ABC transporter [Pseudomonas amygdali pv. morsprunorum]
MNQVKQFFTRYKMLALVIAIAVIWLFFSWQTDGGFLTPRNLSNLLRQMSITGILACGMVLVIISGEIDLSVGSLLGLLGGLAAILDVVYHVPLLANLSLVALCGLMIGLANGYMTAYLCVFPPSLSGWAVCWPFAAFFWGLPAARPSPRYRLRWSTSARDICRTLSVQRLAYCCWP